MLSWLLARSRSLWSAWSRPVAPPPEGDADIRAALDRQARVQARLGLGLETIERKLDALLARPVSPERPEPPPDDILDALDRLDDAVASIDPDTHAGLAEGLRLIASRLQDHLAARGLERIATVQGAPPDGRSFRVIGSEPRPDLPAGVVVRVVRAAVRRSGRLVREGEVLVSRAP